MLSSLVLKAQKLNGNQQPQRSAHAQYHAYRWVLRPHGNCVSPRSNSLDLNGGHLTVQTQTWILNNYSNFLELIGKYPSFLSWRNSRVFTWNMKSSFIQLFPTTKSLLLKCICVCLCVRSDFYISRTPWPMMAKLCMQNLRFLYPIKKKIGKKITTASVLRSVLLYLVFEIGERTFLKCLQFEFVALT